MIYQLNLKYKKLRSEELSFSLMPRTQFKTGGCCLMAIFKIYCDIRFLQSPECQFKMQISSMKSLTSTALRLRSYFYEKIKVIIYLESYSRMPIS